MAEAIATPDPIQKGPESCAGPSGKEAMIWGKVYVPFRCQQGSEHGEGDAPTSAPILPTTAAKAYI